MKVLHTDPHDEHVATWVVGVSMGDADAFRALYEYFHRDLYRFTIQVVKSSMLAEDVVHDVFLRVWEKREQLDATRSIKSYLFTICRNRILTLLERAATETRILDELVRHYHVDADENDKATDIFTVENEKLVRDAISKLPNQRRYIFEMAKLEGLTYDQIAEQLGISRGTVCDHIVKSNRFIRTYLQTHVTLQLIWLLVDTNLN